MNIYLDFENLAKAVQVPSTATDTISEERGARQYNESFHRQSSGVTGGDPTADDPQQGGKWSHDDGDGDTEGDDTKRDSEVAREKGVSEKSIEAVDMLKSFTSMLNAQVRAFMPNETEIEYLTTQCYSPNLDEKGNRIHYTREDVLKGRATIEGSERGRFTDWLNDRFQKSVGKLTR